MSTGNSSPLSFDVDTPHPLLQQDQLTPEDRTRLLEEYVSRGRAVHIADDRGLPDSHRRREANLGQFFTPTHVARRLAQALGLAAHPAWGGEPDLPPRGALVDFAGCGNGRLLQFAPAGWSKHGADVDPLAVRAARLIHPDAEILEQSLLDFEPQRERTFNVAVINPPFSIPLHRSALRLSSACWGVWGRNTSALSHQAAVEIAMSLAPVVGAVLPTPSLDAGEFDALTEQQFGRPSLPLALRIDLPRDAFRDEGTEWPCSLAIFASTFQQLNVHLESWEEVDAALAGWISAQAQASGGGHHASLPRLLSLAPEAPPSLRSCTWTPHARRGARPDATPAAEHDPSARPTVRLALGGRAHLIRLKPNGPLAAHAIAFARHQARWIVSPGFSPQNKLDWLCDLVRNAGHAQEMIELVIDELRSFPGVDVVVDEQLRRHAARADRRTAVELSDCRQYVRQGSVWIPRGYDPVFDDTHPARATALARFAPALSRAQALPSGGSVPHWDSSKLEHRLEQWPALPIYPFAQTDIARALTKRASIYSAKQGLGKTRFSIGTVIAAGVKCAVWVLETRLVNEFKRELAKLHLLQHFHLIEKKEDLKHLRRFNVITYSTLRKPLQSAPERPDGRWGPGKTFAAALARRRPFVIVDEAHKVASATTKQGIATRHLCCRARRVLLMTGTAIRNYPRNLLGLAVAGWGDGSSMNPYGYRRPVEGNYSAKTAGGSSRRRHPLVRGVARFVDEFVDVVWFTPQFEQTASSGMKSREIPRVKNPVLWDSFVRPKIIRRLPGEPEVRASIKTPEADPVFEAVPPTPEHFAHYKRVLDRFAAIWKARLEREGRTGVVENSAAHILPEIDALRFASTIPIAHHSWADDDPSLRYGSTAPTAVMLRALHLIAGWVASGDRVLVGAEKPDALRWLRDLLADLPTYVPDADPISAVLAHDTNITRRNALIDQVRDNPDASVLLLSIGMGKEGLNLGSMSKLVTLDLGWVPGDLDQYRHRILRPDQVGDPEIVHLFHAGFIDAYMKQLNSAKSDAIDNAIDGQATTFDYSNWLTYRDFALSMLSQEGYAFATRALEETCVAHAA